MLVVSHAFLLIIDLVYAKINGVIIETLSKLLENISGSLQVILIVEEFGSVHVAVTNMDMCTVTASMVVKLVESRIGKPHNWRLALPITNGNKISQVKILPENLRVRLSSLQAKKTTETLLHFRRTG